MRSTKFALRDKTSIEIGSSDPAARHLGMHVPGNGAKTAWWPAPHIREPLKVKPEQMSVGCIR
jgi:hypothetical protein